MDCLLTHLSEYMCCLCRLLPLLSEVEVQGRI